MFKWYQNAQFCYADLATLHLPRRKVELNGYAFREQLPLGQPFTEHNDPRKQAPMEWFQRAWTLQELLAPRMLHFFNAQWEIVGDRSGLRLQIERATGIPQRRIKYYYDASVAAKLSWAAGRKSSREEDRVYSLFGLFGVAIDIRYGEGEEEAFLRLQKEIIQVDPSETIFAWQADLERSGLLAPTIDSFADSGNVFDTDIHKTQKPIPHHLNSGGMQLQISRPMDWLPSTDLTATHDFLRGRRIEVFLNAYEWRGRDPRKLTIKLVATFSGAERIQDARSFIRVDCNHLGSKMDPRDYSNRGGQYHAITVLDRRHTTPSPRLYQEPRKPARMGFTYPPAYQPPNPADQQQPETQNTLYKGSSDY